MITDTTATATELPHLGLSIRQPWAWLIAAGHKNIENRTWSQGHYRGPICIHAAKSTTRKEWKDAEAFAQRILGRSFLLPDIDMVQYGGIIATANLTGIIDATHLAEPQGWLTGPYGWRLENVQEVPFVPLRGALGLFDRHTAAARLDRASKADLPHEGRPSRRLVTPWLFQR